MPGFLSKVFKKDGSSNKPQNGGPAAPAKPRWTDAWQRTEVQPEEIQELLHGVTAEIKSRALQLPFLLLPFRPASDPSAARTFVRNFFGSGLGNEPPMGGQRLATELRLAEPLVLCSVMKWCWSRLAGGVVTWDAYELFKIGENDSHNARTAFSTFIPISTANDARTKIINDFFDLMAAIAAHGKSNGFPGLKLSRYAGWWAFEHKDSEKGFEGGYKTWAAAADATCHLFFAYLRSLAPDPTQGALTLPLSLQALLEQSEYPPAAQPILESVITKVVMIVDSVSPTPFALLRRAKNFEYRSDDQILQSFAGYDDPVQALTDECKRILQGIATANDSSSSKLSTSLGDASWSRFEDIGFSDNNEEEVNSGLLTESALKTKRIEQHHSLKTMPASTTNLDRPTTPSWADFLSTGFPEQPVGGPGPLLPPDKQLPPISIRAYSSHSHKRSPDVASELSSGELASVKPISIDDVFWWVWITSLSGEETISRKATFGRCALVETRLQGGQWLLLEEVLKGAKAEPANHTYVAEKKSRFGFRIRSTKNSAKSTPTKSVPRSLNTPSPSARKTIAPDQHARIQAAAAALSQKGASTQPAESPIPERRGRFDDGTKSKTTSVMTLQPVIMNEAAPAMKWARTYDKDEVRAKYLGDKFAGRGSAVDLPTAEVKGGARSTNGSIAPVTAPATSAGVRPDEDAVVTALPSPPAEQVIPVVPQAATSSDAPPKTPVAKKDEVVSPRPTERAEPSTPGSALTKTTTNDRINASPAAKDSPTPSGSSPMMKRKNVPARFGSIFGRKRTEEAATKGNALENSKASPAGVNAGPGSAVAAARAALEAKAQQNTKSIPRQPVMVKRTSVEDNTGRQATGPEGMAPSSKNISSPVETPAAVAAAAAAATAAEPTINPDQLQNAGEKLYEPSYTTDSHIDENETYAAEKEFSRFDQGPLNDAPAYDTTDMQKESPISAESSETNKMDALAASEPSTSVALEQDNVQSVTSTDQAAQLEPDVARDRALSNERWAQIRKNAAERAAARQSEEQSGVTTTNTTEDTETSGEETIESRVARIKARVAELTSSMDVPSPTERNF